jgi:hypothetical protein
MSRCNDGADVIARKSGVTAFCHAVCYVVKIVIKQICVPI